jgi:hypothetical protein
MAMALLIAQLGAMAHAYSHDAQLGAMSAGNTLGGQPSPGSHDFCSDCLNFAPLLSVCGASMPLPCILPPGQSPAPLTAHRSRVEYCPHLAFRSRAPPVTH